MTLQYVVNVFKGDKLIRHIEIEHSNEECKILKNERLGSSRAENAPADTVHCPACGKSL